MTQCDHDSPYPCLKGTDFTWFAVDQDGCIGVFTTAGEGTVPQSVIENSAAHTAVAETLELPNWGSEHIWSDYAKLGFFVFDWDLEIDGYVRMSVPLTAADPTLVSRINAITRVPRQPFTFSSWLDVADQTA